ncbi:MAG: hypothetical protein RLZ37_2024, partial [Actinomycetota bacterium]
PQSRICQFAFLVVHRLGVRMSSCELCDAAPLTERFYEDDQCWIAECEACFVPMVVWKSHDPSPPADVKGMLHRLLLEVVGGIFDGEPYVDDNMRTIPDHYHAHARWRGHYLAQSPPRRNTSPLAES